jgi:DNA-binding transcriptional LysR family regulator
MARTSCGNLDLRPDGGNTNSKIVDIHVMNDIADLNLVAVFEAVWRHRQISRAAAELNSSQPTVSNALRRLRAAMDDRLFVRSGQMMVPTPLAEEIAPHWCDGLMAIRKGGALKSGFNPATDRRRFSLLMTDIAEAVILPHLLEACRVSAPSVSFRTTQLDVEKTLPALRSGEVDLAIGYLPSLRSGVKQQLLFESDYVVISRKDHPALGRSGKLTRSAFLGCRHALAEATGTGHVVVERALKRVGLGNRIGTRVPHFLALPMIVAASDLLATVPRPLARLLISAAPIAIHQHPMKFSNLPIRLFWHERFDADIGLRWLRHTLRHAVHRAEVLRP